MYEIVSPRFLTVLRLRVAGEPRCARISRDFDDDPVVPYRGGCVVCESCCVLLSRYFGDEPAVLTVCG